MPIWQQKLKKSAPAKKPTPRPVTRSVQRPAPSGGGMYSPATGHSLSLPSTLPGGAPNAPASGGIWTPKTGQGLPLPSSGMLTKLDAGAFVQQQNAQKAAAAPATTKLPLSGLAAGLAAAQQQTTLAQQQAAFDQQMAQMQMQQQYPSGGGGSSGGGGDSGGGSSGGGDSGGGQQEGGYADDGGAQVIDDDGQHMEDEDEGSDNSDEEVAGYFDEELDMYQTIPERDLDHPNVDPFREVDADDLAPEDDVGNVEIEGDSNTEIGEVEQAIAVQKTIEKARDNRMPSPRMRAVDIDAPLPDQEQEDWLHEVFIGAAEVCGGEDQFPLMTKLMLRFSGGQDEPRFVRIDTEKSYVDFMAENSAEHAAFREAIEALSEKLAHHSDDPNAHMTIESDIESVDLLGEEVKAAEAEKKVDLWLPEHLKNKVHAWVEGDFVCASIVLPGCDGELRICTSMEPVRKCVEEMERHAQEAGVHGAAIAPVLPAMATVLGAGTLVKEMSAAAPEVLARPEAAKVTPFVVRIEPKSSPAVCALMALAQGCLEGDAQACDEWQRLGNVAKKAAPISQAMNEAITVLKR